MEEGIRCSMEGGSDGLMISTTERVGKRGLCLLTFLKWLMSWVFIDDLGYKVTVISLGSWNERLTIHINCSMRSLIDNPLSFSQWSKHRRTRQRQGDERWPGIWCSCELWTNYFLILLSPLKDLWITQRMGSDDSHHKPQRIRFSMNKITGGIHIEKYNSFAHKCVALIAGVHDGAATLCLTHYFKHHTAQTE